MTHHGFGLLLHIKQQFQENYKRSQNLTKNGMYKSKHSFWQISLTVGISLFLAKKNSFIKVEEKFHTIPICYASANLSTLVNC